MKACFCLFIILTFTPSSFAEYRAYRLRIINSVTGQERLVMSTMDHLQYPDYFPVQGTETVGYVESWMCHGNTSGYKPICAPPSARSEPARTPAGGNL